MRQILLILATVMGFSTLAQNNVELEWTFFHPKKSVWMELGKKGSVQEALIATGEMPDPFYGTNENKFGWFEEHQWEFKSILIVSQEDLDHQYNELWFGSIDTYGKVYVNDSLVIETANAFIPHSVQVKNYLKLGVNEVTVVITPPVLQHADMWKNADYKLPAPNDVHDIAIAPYTRKPQYQFGWDWALRLNTIGFNKPATLYTYNTNRIVNKGVNTLEVNDTSATIDFMVQFAVDYTGGMNWLSSEFNNKRVNVIDGVAHRIVTVYDPKLWWPTGHGESFLYSDDVRFTGVGNELVGDVEFNYGIKTSELVQEKDEWGTSYYFKINGQRIFCKGGDYIPQDIFPARVKDEDIEKLVEDMALSNFNMIRVWGGGYYPDEVFFETCDRLGIMVWQDLMFACAMYPGDDAFIANVSEEFEYQVPRIAGHASVVQFNGNNEVEVAWGNWGFQIKYGLYGKSAKEIERSYDRLFKEVAPEIIAKHTNVPYIHTSPLSNWGKTDLYNHGSQHYWGVWHGNDPIQDFGKKIGRFNAEYGFQSFPEYTTISTFAEKKDWDLSSDVMKHHQKSYVGNNMILKHAKKLYGTPETFEDFVYYSQLTQSMAVSMAVAGHRIDAPRCGGTLYWQINDCWPAPSWSSVDYFGNWKALQYRIKDDYEEVAVVAKYNDLENIDYYLVSGVEANFDCGVVCKVVSLKGEEVSQEVFDIEVKGQNSFQLDIKELKEKCRQKNAHLIFTWKDNLGVEHKRSFDHLPKEYKRATDDDVTVEFERVNTESGTAIAIVTNKKFIQDAWLIVDQAGVKFSENFVSYLPGTHKIKVEFQKGIPLNTIEIKWL
ncbi:hypothetical protein N8329_01655 [Crocinitomicaceae bacterium]|nr:hypothetical protein [Crocinitomicaceae bacterium]